MKTKLFIYLLLGICFYLIFDWSATNLDVLRQTVINIDDNLALRSFYTLMSLTSFILLIRCLYLSILTIFTNKKEIEDVQIH